MADEDELRAADRQEIADALIGYCVALDRMDLDALAALFTEDCVVEFGPDERLNSRGRAALAKSLERMWRWTRTSHHLSNVIIEFTGSDEATSRAYVLAWHERPDGTTATVYGQYHDRLQRVDGQWLIAARRMVENGSDAGFTVGLHKLERRPPPLNFVAPDVDRPPAKRSD